MINQRASYRFSGDEPRKFFDPSLNMTAVKVNPGTHYVTSSPEVIVTSLGSCVSACVRDFDRGIGGMNHFMLPGESQESGSWGGASAAMRYGAHAMETLINDVLNMGGRRNSLEIKLFGGSSLIASGINVGQRNIEFVRHWLQNEHFEMDAHHLGGEQSRRIKYFPQNGRVRMTLLDNATYKTIVADEERLQIAIEETPIGGDVELFQGND